MPVLKSRRSGVDLRTVVEPDRFPAVSRPVLVQSDAEQAVTDATVAFKIVRYFMPNTQMAQMLVAKLHAEGFEIRRRVKPAKVRPARVKPVKTP